MTEVISTNNLFEFVFPLVGRTGTLGIGRQNIVTQVKKKCYIIIVQAFGH